MMNNNRLQPPVYPIDKLVIPEVVNVSLTSGLPVFLIEAGTEDLMRVEFVFRAGQIYETIPLLSSATNMMLTEGSENFTSEQINSNLDFYGAFINHSAERDRAGIVVYFLSKYIGKVLELCHEILFRPAFPGRELQLLMSKRLQWFLVNKEKVNNLAHDNFFELIFGNSHPYGRMVNENDFRKLTPEILKQYHSDLYTADNMAIIVSGKIHETTIQLLDQYFGNIASKKRSGLASVPDIQGSQVRTKHIRKPGSLQTAIRIGSATVNKTHSDYTGLKVVDTILGGYFGSRLMKNIREEKGFTYGINSSLSSLEQSGYKVIGTEVAGKTTQEAISEIYNEIAKLQNISVGEEEINLVRNYMSGEMVRMFDGPFALADSFRAVWDFGLDHEYFYRLSEKIKTIGADEIMHLAKTYYNTDDLYQVTAGEI
jgi:zinc protease